MKAGLKFIIECNLFYAVVSIVSFNKGRKAMPVVSSKEITVIGFENTGSKKFIDWNARNKT